MLNSDQMHCGVYDSQLSQRYKNRTPQRQVQRYELELYHTDSGTSYVDGKAYPVRRGMLLCARPGQLRHSQLPIRSSYIWIDGEGAVTRVLQQLPICIYIDEPEATERLLRLFHALHSAMHGSYPEPEGTVTRNRLLLEILQNCLQLCRGGEQRPMTSRLIREAYSYMDKHFCENCTLEKIAQAVHVSANHLHTAFMQSEGITPYDYVAKKRIDRAKTLILQGDSSLAQIALETGFCSQSHFTAAFKKSTGQTPARYRKNLFDWK